VEQITRSLTDQEARVIGLLLEDSPEGDRARLRRWRIARSTYHHIRRRATMDAWIGERYIPDPRTVGRPWLSVLLTRPFADRHTALVGDLARDPAIVHLAVTPGMLFAVAWDSEKEAAQRRWESLKLEGRISGGLQLTAQASEPTVPVYFDFEGMWCHMADLPGPAGYPRAVPTGRFASGDEPFPRLTNHQRWAMRYLLERSSPAAGHPATAPRTSAWGLPSSARKMLELGWVSHRTLLAPLRIPPFQSRQTSRLYFVVGRPRPGRRPEELFQELVQDCRVYPFLWVVGDERWLIGAAGGPSGSERPVSRGRPVLPTIGESVTAIEIFEMEGASMTTPIDHCYDRLLVPGEQERPP